MNARAVALEKARDAGVLRDGTQELDMAIADLEEDRLDAELLDDLAVLLAHVEPVAVDLQRRLEVLHGDADVIDAPEHRGPV